MKGKLKTILISVVVGGVLYCFYDGYVKMTESMATNNKILSTIPDNTDNDSIYRAFNEDIVYDSIKEQANKKEETSQKTNCLDKEKTTWKKLAKQVAKGGEIIGVWEIYHPSYTMIYKLNRDYYYVDFDTNNGVVDKTFQLKKVDKNTFKYIDNEEELIVIKGDEIKSYMNNPIEGGRFEASSYSKAK